MEMSKVLMADLQRVQTDRSIPLRQAAESLNSIRAQIDLLAPRIADQEQARQDFHNAAAAKTASLRKSATDLVWEVSGAYLAQHRAAFQAQIGPWLCGGAVWDELLDEIPFFVRYKAGIGEIFPMQSALTGLPLDEILAVLDRLLSGGDVVQMHGSGGQDGPAAQEGLGDVTARQRTAEILSGAGTGSAPTS
jgi:hypothetical protein